MANPLQVHVIALASRRGMRFRAGQPGNLSEGVKLMIKITGFEHVSWASKDLEPAQSTLALFGIRPTGFEEIHSQHVTSNYYEADCGAGSK